MDIDEWKQAAKRRLLSGKMTDQEWESVLSALLHVSEGEGIDEFDDVIYGDWNNRTQSPAAATLDRQPEIMKQENLDANAHRTDRREWGESLADR